MHRWCTTGDENGGREVDPDAELRSETVRDVPERFVWYVVELDTKQQKTGYSHIVASKGLATRRHSSVQFR
jgi:hypothetical protein